MRSQMISLLQIVEQPAQLNSLQAAKLLASFNRLQQVHLKVMMSASCRVLDTMLELAGLLYKKVGGVLLSEQSVFDCFCKVIKNDIKVMKTQ